ncbi:thiopeptide-type bacteriocin biosynthesis protein [Actinoplanes sp. NPDC024001]|uniref:thiopeptide-type bacteriocin biosynthesis protein n=1 Tax=Actinoplanes sp. NPDC024001 TaxID=3154598 RepID=UPI0033CD9B27
MAAPISSTTSAERTDWLSLHAFYAADEDRLLVDGVAPLIRSLRERRLIERYFFIRYWLEGPHVRLRLRPAAGVAADDLAAEVETRIAAYLARHPSADPVLPRQDTYRSMFLAEYGQASWDRRYGRDGHMPVRHNNTVRREEYAPEYERYGGPAGIELAEWHFEVSSDLVLRLLADRSPQRRARLGLSAQLGLILCLTFLGDDARAAAFLDGYRDFWANAYGPAGADLSRMSGAASLTHAGPLRRRAEQIRATLRAAGPDQPAPGGWLTHCRLLRQQVAALTAAGELEPPPGAPAGALPERLLHSYLHMTNNRLGVGVLEEAYLAGLLRTVLTGAGGAP